MTEFIGWLFILPAVVICVVGYCCMKLAEANPEKAGEVMDRVKEKAAEYEKRRSGG